MTQSDKAGAKAGPQMEADMEPDLEALLDGLFAQARSNHAVAIPAEGQAMSAGQVPAALLARVMADADLILAEQQAARAPQASPVSQSWRAAWDGFVAMIGGPRALGGLTAAALTGLWIGVASGPEVASYLGVSSVVQSGALQALETVELMPEGDMFAMLGGLGSADGGEIGGENVE